MVSQWNTSNNSRSDTTQFNVKGVDKFFGIDLSAPKPEPLETSRTPACLSG
ncbi:hypothetical protein [Corynebacterium pilosum]|uniref:Putative secreted protein n=1 Tax=Corynebacterium pilosum TaxID=35756 RepID=A0A376CNM3_9CORY|nr:hypothetical protein [Corynebacterium pilosum]STC70116.1 putative secreted protein [Corynebacterium pilosum]